MRKFVIWQSFEIVQIIKNLIDFFFRRKDLEVLNVEEESKVVDLLCDI